jgi:D-beta-D-heptose 7-phosphate kinase / D-beta-D-heptose 1-phosphate adenosyltransferase
MKARILVLGDAMIDIYVQTKVDRISPEAPVPVVRKNGAVQISPGGALNVAANAAALGGDVAVVGVLGAEPDAGAVRADLESRGVDTRGLYTAHNVSTVTKTRFIARSQQIMRVDDEIGPTHYLAARQVVTRLLEDALRRDAHQIVLLSDYGKGTVAPEHLAMLRQFGANGGPRTIADPFGRISGRYGGLWGLKANRIEASALTGHDVLDWEGSEEAARALSLEGFETIWITLGGLGSLVLSAPGSASRHPSRSRSVYDVTGAGDTFLAALGVALGEGGTIRDATTFANAASGAAVEQAGTTVVSRSALKDGHNSSGGDRLLNFDEAAMMAEHFRGLGRRIGFTNGCFDLIHPGHVDSLDWAAQQVDVLFVGINTDDTVRDTKGSDRPVFTCVDRGRMLLALRAVNFVIPFSEATPEDLIRRIRPDVLFKGEDWAHFVAGREIVESYGGCVKLIPRTPGFSTTNLIERIRRPAQES